MYQLLGNIRQQYRVGAKLLSQGTGAFQGTVGHHDTLYSQVMQVAGDQGNRLARTDQQGLAALQIAEDLLGQAHRGKGHRNRVFTDGGVGAHLFGRVERGLEQAPQQRPDRARLTRHGIGRLHLAENLRFAQHQRIQA